MTNFENKKLGLCLSGGSALGYAHIGVLQALKEHNIHPNIISGSSMGAIIGALYANGVSPEKLLQIVRDEKMYRISTLLNPTFGGIGFSSHKQLRKLLQEFIPHNKFELLEKEFHVCVSNINKAEWEMKSTGNLAEYIVASASIPFLYEAVEIEKTTYVDGGLFNNFPAQILKDKCDKIIGVDVLPYFHKRVINSTNEMIILTIRGVEHRNSDVGRKLCDYLIESPAIKKFNEFNFDKYEQIVKSGYDTTAQYIKANPDILELQSSI